MKRLYFFCVALGFCLLFINAACASGPNIGDAVNPQAIQATEDQGAPAAVISELKYTFDPVPAGTEVRHDFVLENHGTAPLKIEKVGTG